MDHGPGPGFVLVGAGGGGGGFVGDGVLVAVGRTRVGVMVGLGVSVTVTVAVTVGVAVLMPGVIVLRGVAGDDSVTVGLARNLSIISGKPPVTYSRIMAPRNKTRKDKAMDIQQPMPKCFRTGLVGVLEASTSSAVRSL